MAGEWATRALGELCEFRAGSVFKPHLQGKATGAYPFVKVSDMNLPANAFCIREANNWVSQADLRELGAKPFPLATVVFAKIGEALRHNRLRQLVRETLIDNNMMGAIPRADQIDPRFFYYMLSQFDFSDIAQGTALPYLTVAALSQLRVEIPPLTEQRAIAHILGALEDKIEVNQRMNETLEAMARAIFKSWFVDFDPVHAKMVGRLPRGMSPEIAALFPDSFGDSPLGKIPKGWRAGTIDEVGDSLRSSVKPGEVPEKTPYIGLEHMPRRSIALSEWGLAGDVTSNKSAFESGQILFGKLRPYFHKVGVAPVDGVCSTDILVVTPKTSEWFGLLLGHLSSVEFINYVDAASTGTKMPRTNWSDMSRYEIAIPIDDIAMFYTQSIVEPTVAKIRANIMEVKTLAETRDTLSPKLLSGEIRLKDAEKIAGQVA